MNDKKRFVCILFYIRAMFKKCLRAITVIPQIRLDAFFCFRWEVEDWQVCSQSCGRGFRTRIVKCIIDKDGNKEQVMKFFILNYRLLFRNMKFMLDEMMFTFRILVFTSSKFVILLALMYYLHVFLQTSCSSE